ncbi:DNA-3-methyladenine glycosylase family protein [Pseudomonas sp. NPDC089530]|uniref:DNA-3-methyladenine glycosylase family protein n=1 Tax=Pseudomonas sp. NPDC089530 TaxID=3390651 RepID=UPI003D009287
MRLVYRPPYDWPAMLAFLQARAIDGLERVSGERYWRSISLDGVHGWFSVGPGEAEALAPSLDLQLHFPEPHAHPRIVARIRRLLDLDTDLAPIHRHLSNDPLMARLIAVRPGLRVPGAWDGFELAVRAVLGQQITVTAAIRLAGKLVARYGQPLCDVGVPEGLSHVFPEPARMAGADLASLGMPRSRGRTLSGVAQAVLDDPQLFAPKASLEHSLSALLALWGVGDWTAHYVALRQFREADAFPAADVGLINALTALEGGPVTPSQLLARAEAWRPWRGYAAQHLWTAL